MIKIPFKDPSTNNGDWREDAEYRMGWNACRDYVIKAPSPQLDKEKMGQAIFDFFAEVDNGDGTFAFDNYDARDIDILVDAIIEGIS